MKFTYYGQSCFLIEADGKKFLFDPFIKPNPLAKDIDTTKIEADYILVSHGHGDHVADLAELAKQTGAEVIAMVEVAKWIKEQGVEKVTDINFGVQQLSFGKLRTVWAVHSSSNPDGSYGGNPAGFVMELAGKQVYIAGDTALTVEMKLLAELYNLDYAILPIGGHYTMDVTDAVIAAKYVECKHVIGVHYDTFPPISIDKDDAVAKFKRENRTLLLPAIGETISL
ncbi:metal-dependent hydrolase [Pedobacter sandarakinus]|uniref:metal-dependent hydrolase n=1 Tax=Pedobacter sandarakinus TaxID=353156 RepID=UPI0022467CE4|nr:metal-dependent hydrolase [Pedobacter sandarakinus]MCX2573523.1 metal-dependent hydrolase [Pedobacter sandarakinus]